MSSARCMACSLVDDVFWEPQSHKHLHHCPSYAAKRLGEITILKHYCAVILMWNLLEPKLGIWLESAILFL